MVENEESITAGIHQGNLLGPETSPSTTSTLNSRKSFRGFTANFGSGGKE